MAPCQLCGGTRRHPASVGAACRPEAARLGPPWHRSCSWQEGPLTAAATQQPSVLTGGISGTSALAHRTFPKTCTGRGRRARRNGVCRGTASCREHLRYYHLVNVGGLWAIKLLFTCGQTGLAISLSPPPALLKSFPQPSSQPRAALPTLLESLLGKPAHGHELTGVLTAPPRTSRELVGM